MEGASYLNLRHRFLDFSIFNRIDQIEQFAIGGTARLHRAIQMVQIGFPLVTIADLDHRNR